MRDIEYLFTSVNVWKQGGELALHKPLLLLFALGHYRNGGERLIPYKVADRNLILLFRQFAVNSAPPRTYFPFWRLRNDAIWEVERSELIRTTSQGDAWKTDLEKYNVGGGLTATIHACLLHDLALFDVAADAIIQRFFAGYMRQELLQAVGLRKKNKEP